MLLVISPRWGLASLVMVGFYKYGDPTGLKPLRPVASFDVFRGLA